MGRWCLGIVLFGAIGMRLGANDYTAEIANGGLRARKETRVAMRSERLFISQSKIRVEYEFVNESSEIAETVVAFPWPGYSWGGASIDLPRKSMLDFSVSVDGVQIPHQTEVRARVNGKEITEELKHIGVDAATFGNIADLDTNHPWMDASHLSKLKAIGALDQQEFPNWMSFVTHYWVQKFLPGKTIKITHEYQPADGGSSYGDLAMIQSPKTDGADWQIVEHDFDNRDPGCPDAAFSKAYLARRVEFHRQRPEMASMGLGFSWVRYILTTANTWKGPIRNFELIVERNPDELVTFCWDGPVEKVGPNRFRAVRKDFHPEKELTVYFVPSLKQK